MSSKQMKAMEKAKKKEKKDKKVALAKAKKERRMANTALLRMVEMLPRGVLMMVFVRAGWDITAQSTDERVVILLSLRRTAEANAAFVSTITSRKAAKAARKAAKKGTPKRSPLGIEYHKDSE